MRAFYANSIGFLAYEQAKKMLHEKNIDEGIEIIHSH